MKRLSYYFCFLLFAITSAHAQIRLGPEVGANFTMQRQTVKTDSTGLSSTRNSTMKVGTSIGVNVDIKVLQKMYFQTGLFYAYDDIVFNDNVDYTAYNLGNAKISTQDGINYFKIPLYFMYKSGYDGMGRFIAGIGPYVGYAFIANRSITTPKLIYDNAGNPVSYDNVKGDYQLYLGSDPLKDSYKKWDYGLNACIGYESNVGLFFRGSVNYGFSNLIPGNPDMRQRNWGIGLSIGYNFGKDDW